MGGSEPIELNGVFGESRRRRRRGSESAGGSASFYNEITVQLMHKLPRGVRSLRVRARAAGDGIVRFIAT